MTRIYNRLSEKEKRRILRRNMTRAEVLLWIQLKNKHFLGLRVLRQYSVGAYVLDFYIPRIRLAIEVDGATHCTDEELEYDKHRQEEIESLGIKFLRCTNHEVCSEMSGVLESIKAKARELMVNRLSHVKKT
ncbi:MAG: endonuclease domain-containing protein [Bacteroidota bacterium]|jgi:very-short-patch-repair endonuclease